MGQLMFRMPSRTACVRYAPLVVYGLLTMLILGPLLTPGFVFALDMVFAPTIALPESSTPSYPFYVLLDWLSRIVPVEIIQKILLVAILLLSALGAHRMVRFFARDIKPPLPFAEFACYAAGLVYMVNPFVYDRFLAGQFAVLLGYALLPWCALAFFRFVRRPGGRLASIAAAWTVAISVVSVHTLGMVAVLAAVMGIQRFWILRHNFAQQVNLLRWATLATGLTLAVSSYWLVPLALGNGQLSQAVGGFTAAHRSAFATTPGEVGVELNVLFLQGFWAEATDLLILPQDESNWWLLWASLLLILVIFGGWCAWHRQRQIAVIFIVSGAIGWILATGSENNLFAPVNAFLTRYVPFFAGYRESQKFGALVVLGYAYCATFGVAIIGGRVRKLAGTYGRVVAMCSMVVLMLLPIVNTRLMFWGFNGQLQSSFYPSDWYETRDLLHKMPSNGKVLFLPWHLYMRYDFANTVIASPAVKFFGPRMVVNDNPELGEQSIAPRTFARQLDALLDPKKSDNHHRFAAKLRQHDIQYILLAREADWRDYDFVARQPDVILLSETTNLMLFQIK